MGSIPASSIVHASSETGANDRTTFDASALEDLAASIERYGLAQPITVRPVAGNGHYEIIAGERRFRAMVDVLGWERLEVGQHVLVRDLDDRTASAIMLAENLAREDLPPISEARALQRRLDAGHTTAEVATMAGQHASYVTRRVKLLGLREDLQKLVDDGQLSVGYAEAIADSQLDVNRQLIAFRKLRENPAPTVSWFRRVCSDLQQQQAQATMFDLKLLTAHEILETVEAEDIEWPPHPSKDRAPRVGFKFSQIARSQASYWESAAEDWERWGKHREASECRAAAEAILSLAEALQPAKLKPTKATLRRRG